MKAVLNSLLNVGLYVNFLFFYFIDEGSMDPIFEALANTTRTYSSFWQKQTSCYRTASDLIVQGRISCCLAANAHTAWQRKSPIRVHGYRARSPRISPNNRLENDPIIGNHVHACICVFFFFTQAQATRVYSRCLMKGFESRPWTFWHLWVAAGMETQTHSSAE